MNFIAHFLGVIHKIAEDKRLHATHVSLYVSLFALWNLNRFQNPLSLTREEVMSISKIGSKNTYHKCLKDLHNFQYLIYHPSNNPLRGSLVEMLSFDSIKLSQALPIDLPNNHPKSGTSTGTTVGHVVGPSLNYINITNNNNIDNDGLKVFEESPLPKVEEEEKKREVFRPPQLSELKEYFISKGFPEMEAEKFFNYYQATDWKIGGRAKMKNWAAAVSNWMLNYKKFNPDKKASGLKTTTDKNYEQPL